MLSLHDIEKILSAELDAAKKRNAIAVDIFRSVINEIPSGIPTPDGTFRIQTAGAERHEALQELHKALKRLNGFVVLGIIPDEPSKTVAVSFADDIYRDPLNFLA